MAGIRLVPRRAAVGPHRTTRLESLGVPPSALASRLHRERELAKRAQALQRLNAEDLFFIECLGDDSFTRWLVGFTEGYGGFHIIKQSAFLNAALREKPDRCSVRVASVAADSIQSDRFSDRSSDIGGWAKGDKGGFANAAGRQRHFFLNFSITQSTNNAQILFRVKKRLKAGSVSVDPKQAIFRIRNRALLSKVVFPIFERCPMLTSKQFYYDRFKKAYLCLEDKNLSTAQKNLLTDQLRTQKPRPPASHCAPA